ncbi:MAG: helix-turn-helix domain-containing protein [Planctomycetota bacterium]
MAKLFYSLEEAAQRLGKSEDEVKEMASSGQLQEFRDRDRLVFKREQVDLLAGGGDADMGDGVSLADTGADPLAGSSIGLAESGVAGFDLSGSGSFGSMSDPAGGSSGTDMGGAPAPAPPTPEESRIPLADSGAGDMDLSASGTGSGLDLGGESGAGGLGLGASSGLSGIDLGGSSAGDGASTGISIFDADETEDADPAAQTQISDDLGYVPEFAQDAGASGSGLLDLTREADDTSLGADLLEDLYGGSETMGEDEAANVGEESALFESTGAESDVSAVGAAAGVAAGALAYVEEVDGVWSGLSGGLAIGATLTLAFTMAIAILSMIGDRAGLVATVGSNMWMYIGICAGVTLLAAGVGFVLGRKG